MKRIIFALSFLAIVTSGLAAKAQDSVRVGKRQLNQQKRIANGVKSGELTDKETARLEKKQAKIQHDKKEAKADGIVTGKEKTELIREQNKANRDIRKQKHDAQKQ